MRHNPESLGSIAMEKIQSEIIKNSESLLGLHHAIAHANNIPPLLKPEISTGSSSGFLLNKIYPEDYSYFAFFDQIENVKLNLLSDQTRCCGACKIYLNFSLESGRCGVEHCRYNQDDDNSNEMSVVAEPFGNNDMKLIITLPSQSFTLPHDKFYPTLITEIKKCHKRLSSMRHGPNMRLGLVLKSISSSENLSKWLKTGGVDWNKEKVHSYSAW